MSYNSDRNRARYSKYASRFTLVRFSITRAITPRIVLRSVQLLLHMLLCFQFFLTFFFFQPVRAADNEQWTTDTNSF